MSQSERAVAHDEIDQMLRARGVAESIELATEVLRILDRVTAGWDVQPWERHG